MTQYDNTNRGVLFDNDRKETDNHPDMTGTLNVDGVDHWFSAWWKDGKSGEFLSLSLGKPKDARTEQRNAPSTTERPQRRGNRPSTSRLSPSTSRQQPRQAAPAGNGFDDMDDDTIPF